MSPKQRSTILRQIFQSQKEASRNDGKKVIPLADPRIYSIENADNNDLRLAMAFDLPDGSIGYLPVDVADFRGWMKHAVKWKRGWQVEMCGERIYADVMRAGKGA